MRPVQPSEIFDAAERRARELEPPAPPADAALERLRTECLTFFERVPEPPVYRRAEDPLRQQAEALVGEGRELLARCLVGARGEGGDRLGALERALRAHLEVVCHTAEGRISEAEEAWLRAGELAEALLRERRAWERSDEGPRRVYDRSTGVSRYDPQPAPEVRARLVCPAPGCRKTGEYAFTVEPGPNRFTCGSCRAPFTAYFGEVLSLERAGGSSGPRHYRIRIKDLGGAVSRLEFDDTSGAELSVARSDRVAFLYTGQRELRGVLNLSSSRVLWIQRAGPCFVATAAFGEDAPELEAFRAFRDECLARSALGRLAVRGYYVVGPSLASGVRRHRGTRRTAERLLRAIHRMLRRAGY